MARYIDVEPVISNTIAMKAICEAIEIDGIVKRLEEAPTVSCNEWISVKDRLPEDSREVLIYDKRSGDVLYAWYSMETWNENDFCYEGDDLDDISHWMPLPEPPERE